MAKNTRQRSGPAGLVEQVTRTFNRGGRRGATGGTGVTGRAASFVAGFLSGDQAGRRKKGRGGRRRR